MSWVNERPHKINIEKATKKYIKSELINYYLYLSKYYELEKDKHGIRTGGSVIKMPCGSVSGDGAQHKTVIHNSGIKELQKPYIEKLTKIDSWLAILTDAQYKVVKTYVMKYQCGNAHSAAIELKYEEDTIKKHTKRAIDRIYSRVKNIL